MQYTTRYASPLGEILLACDDEGMTGLWFVGQKYYGNGLAKERAEKDHPILKEACSWLDCYFAGGKPEKLPPIHLVGTDFRREVWELLLKLPYGTVTTYRKLGRELARRRRLPHMSAQAIGGAVGHNPVSILVPCHRVVGTDGSLTGYAGGTDKKAALLTLEQVEVVFSQKRGWFLNRQENMR